MGFTALEITDTTIGVIPDPDVTGRCDFFAGRGMDVGNWADSFRESVPELSNACIFSYMELYYYH